MKKTFSVILSITIVSVVISYAQTRQQGSVKEFNSGNRPLSGVQLAVHGAAATDTDSDGRFVLDFISMNPGSRISMPDIYKKGYEVVNKDAFDGWILSENRQMDVVMAKVGVIEDARNMYYKIAVSNFSRKQADAVEELNDLYNQGMIDARVRSERLGELSVQQQEYMAVLDEYVDKFARINPDDVSELERKVLELVNAGRIDEAISLYDESGVVGKSLERLSQVAAYSEEAEKLAESLYRYADLCVLSGEKNSDLKALDIYKKVMDAFPDEFRYVSQYTMEALTHHVKGYDELLDRCIDLAYDDKSLIRMQLTKATRYFDGHRFDECIETSLQVMDYLVSEDTSIPSGDAIALYYTAKRLLGNAYWAKDDKDEADKVFNAMAVEIENILETDHNLLLNDILDDMLPEVYNALSEIHLTDEALSDEYALKAYEAAKKQASGNEVELLKAEIQYKTHFQTKSSHVYDKADVMSMTAELADLHERLYILSPTSINATQFALIASNKVLYMIETDMEASFAEIQRIENLFNNENSSENEYWLAMVNYTIQQLYIIYYTYGAEYQKRYEHTLKIIEFADVLGQYDKIANEGKVIKAYDYLLQLYNLYQMKAEALALAYDLDAMFSVANRKYILEPTTVMGDIASAYMLAEKVDLALLHFEEIRDIRESHMKENPHDYETMANLSATYNNLAMCHSLLSQQDKAYEMQVGAVRNIEPFYRMNAQIYGQNYFIMNFNLAIYAYKTGKMDLVVEMIDTVEKLAEEMKGMGGCYATFPVIARLMRGDFMMKTGDSSGEEIVNEVLAYEPGSEADDTLLVYIINDYRTKGTIF